MSFRLTNDLREAIASQAVAHAFDPRKAALTKAEGAQFYAKWEAAPAQTLPTIRVDEINAMLGLAA